MAGSAFDLRKIISIDGSTVELAADENIDELERRIQEAVEHPQFVHIRAADGTDLRFLVSVERRVTIAVVPPWSLPGSPSRADVDTLDLFDL